jgi:hypothetical protein
MKRLISVLLAGSVAFSAAAARAATMQKRAAIQKQVDEYDNIVTYRTVPSGLAKPDRTGWYFGVAGQAGLVSWTYNATAGGVSSSDDMGSATRFGGLLFLGGSMAPAWRGELELGRSLKITDKDTFNDIGWEFSESTTTVAFNGIYALGGGFYAGGGTGLAFVSTELRDALTVSTGDAIAPLAQVMFGWETPVGGSVTLNLGLKARGYYSGNVGYKVLDGNSSIVPMDMNLGFVMDFALVAGGRVNF